MSTFLQLCICVLFSFSFFLDVCVSLSCVFYWLYDVCLFLHIHLCVCVCHDVSHHMYCIIFCTFRDYHVGGKCCKLTRNCTTACSINKNKANENLIHFKLRSFYICYIYMLYFKLYAVTHKHTEKKMWTAWRNCNLQKITNKKKTKQNKRETATENIHYGQRRWKKESVFQVYVVALPLIRLFFWHVYYSTIFYGNNLKSSEFLTVLPENSHFKAFTQKFRQQILIGGLKFDQNIHNRRAMKVMTKSTKWLSVSKFNERCAK